MSRQRWAKLEEQVPELGAAAPGIDGQMPLVPVEEAAAAVEGAIAAVEEAAAAVEGATTAVEEAASAVEGDVAPPLTFHYTGCTEV